MTRRLLLASALTVTTAVLSTGLMASAASAATTKTTGHTPVTASPAGRSIK